MLSRIASRSLISSKQPLVSILCRRGFATEKGEERVANRLDGLIMSDEEIMAELEKNYYDEEGSFTPPHMDNFVSMTRRDVMMNVRIPPLGIEPPPFGEDQIREVEY